MRKRFFSRWAGRMLLTAVVFLGVQVRSESETIQAGDAPGLLVALRYAERDADLATIAKQRLLEAGVRVFDRSAGPDKPRGNDQAEKGSGQDGFVLALGSTATERDSWDGFVLAEGESKLTVSRSGSGEVLLAEVQRATGRRSSIREVAVGTARLDAFGRALDRMLGRLDELRTVPIVREAVIVNVFSEKALLAIMEHLARLEGVRDVRRLSFDRTTNEAHIEVVADRSVEAFWRAHLEEMPKTIVETREAEVAAKTGYPKWLPVSRKE